MKRLFFFCLTVGVIVACSKDKFKTDPQVTITSFGPKEVRKGDIVELLAEVTDKEGDVNDSVLVVRKRFRGAISFTPDTVRRTLAGNGAPQKDKIELIVLLSYGEDRSPIIFENLATADTKFVVGIIVRDTAGHRSQYVETDTITLKKL